MKGFTPDLPRTTEDIITDCTNIIPYESGMEAAPTPVSTGADTLAAACAGAVAITKLDGSNRIFAATTATKIYELSGTSWTDRSSGSGTYTAVSNVQFTQFGDATIAAPYGTALQVSTTGAFAAIATAPQAKVLFSVITAGGGFVIAANTNSFVDQWACCGVNDHTTWTVSVATQANTGRLLGNDAGAITAGIELGDAALIFKRRTMFVGRYVGTPDTWNFQEVPGGAGCIGADARCTIDAGVFFVGPDQFWIFDGARPIPIGTEQIRQWFFSNSSNTYRNKTICVFERDRNRVRIFYASSISSGTLDSQLVYHLVTKQWGRNDISVEYAFTYIEPGVTWATVTGTWATVSYTWDSDSLNPSARTLAIFNTSHVLQTLVGAPSSSSFWTEDIGDEIRETHLTEFKLRYQIVPTLATAYGYVLDEAGDTADSIGSAASYDTPSNAKNKFDLRQCGKFHRVRLDFTGAVRVVSKRPVLIEAGER